MKIFLSGLGLLCSIICGALLFDVIECKIPPDSLSKHAAYGYDEKNVVIYISGKLNCLFSAEGAFPRWGDYIKIKFVKDFNQYDDGVFLTLGVDFTGEHIKSGHIFVNKSNRTMTLSLDFDAGYTSKAALNGVYDTSGLYM